MMLGSVTLHWRHTSKHHHAERTVSRNLPTSDLSRVLSAESDDAARATLDELGFASVQIVIPTEDSETVSGDFGAEETDEGKQLLQG